MKFDVAYSNPPYNNKLHLKILNEAMNICNEIIAIHPAGWLESIFQADKLKKHIREYKILPMKYSNEIFDIALTSDIMIGIYSRDVNEDDIISPMNPIALRCIDKIRRYAEKNDFFKHIENSISTGIRVKVCNYKSVTFGGRGDGEARRCGPYKMAYERGPFKDGIYAGDDRRYSGMHHTSCFMKGGPRNSKRTTELKASILFDSIDEAKNFISSCSCSFFLNWNFITMSKRLSLWMNDYSHAWTDEDYCKFFKLSPEESKFMSRKIDDYRIKDFIRYEI